MVKLNLSISYTSQGCSQWTTSTSKLCFKLSVDDYSFGDCIISTSTLKPVSVRH